MRIGPNVEQQSTISSPLLDELRTADREVRTDDPFDVSLVVVHGMGNAYTSQILLEWAEPLLERIDWLTRDRAIGATAQEGFGVKILGSELTGEVPMITAEVGVPDKNSPEGRRRYRIAILEARWSESFVPMTRRQVFRWAVSFLWRAIGRMLVQFWRTIARVPYLTMRSHVRSRQRIPEFLAGFLVDPFRFVLGVVFAFALTVGVIVLGLIGTLILPLISPLLLIPWFKEKAQAAIDGIVESIGDVATWKERPLRAAAMRLVVRNALDRAARQVGVDPIDEKARRENGEPPSDVGPSGRRLGHVQVLAHSQGAAVTAYTLFSDSIVPGDYRVRRLTTVGAAVVLLGRDRWKGRPDAYHPVRAWLERGPEVTWENHWAIWDPFSAGPIADNESDALSRWQDAYFPERHHPPRGARKTAGAAPTPMSLGPEEHAVHNTSQPFLDHSMYFDNTLQVVDPTARALLPEDVPNPDPLVTYVANRLMVIDKKSLGVNFLLSFVIAALAPGILAVSAALAWVTTTVATLISQLFGLLPFTQGQSFDAVASSSFLIDDATEPILLSGWGWAVASLLILALLIWLNQVLAGVTARAIAWTRCPRNPWRWLAVSSLPRAGYIVIAALCVWYFVVDWSELDDEWWLRAVLAVAAVLTFWEPFIAPVPRIVPASTGLQGRAGVTVTDDGAAAAATAAEEQRITLPDAVGSAAFHKDFTNRMALRKAMQKEQDEADRERAKTAGTLWRLKRRWRRWFVRPVDDWFYRLRDAETTTDGSGEVGPSFANS